MSGEEEQDRVEGKGPGGGSSGGDSQDLAKLQEMGDMGHATAGVHGAASASGATAMVHPCLRVSPQKPVEDERQEDEESDGEEEDAGGSGEAIHRRRDATHISGTDAEARKARSQKQKQRQRQSSSSFFILGDGSYHSMNHTHHTCIRIRIRECFNHTHTPKWLVALSQLAIISINL